MSRRRSAIAACLLLLLSLAASPVRAAAPSNDNAGGATPIGSLPATIAVDLTEATIDGDPGYCLGASASVWYAYTPDADAFLTVGLPSDAANVAIHVGVDDPFSYVDCVYAGNPRTLYVEAGRTYLLEVLTDGSPTSMDISATPTIANDRFEHATVIDTLPATVSPDLTTSTGAGDSSFCGASSNGAWYRLTPTADVTVDLQADVAQSAIATVTGATIDDHVACHYAWNGTTRLALHAGQTYHVQLSAYSPTSSGTSLTLDPLPAAPANDDRAAAITIGSVPFSASVDLRTSHPDDTNGYCFESDWPVVWYRYTPSTAVVLDLEVTGEARAAYFYNGNEDEGPGCTAHNGDAGGKLLATAGTTYEIGFGAPPSVTGPVGLTLTASPAPSIDVVVNPNGTTEKVGGVAVVRGTVRCSGTGRAFVEVALRQRVGRTTLISGDGSVDLDCAAAAVPWTIRVPGNGAPFGSGSVAVEFHGEFGEWPLFVSDHGSTVVKLKGK